MPFLFINFIERRNIFIYKISILSILKVTYFNSAGKWTPIDFWLEVHMEIYFWMALQKKPAMII